MVGGCGVRGDFPIVRPLDLLQESFLLSPSPPKTARSEVLSLAHEREMLLGSASPSSAVPVGGGANRTEGDEAPSLQAPCTNL